MSNDKTHAEMVATVASNYAKEACAATQGVIEAVRGRGDQSPLEQAAEEALRREKEELQMPFPPYIPNYTDQYIVEPLPVCDRCEAILAENYKLVAKVSELQVAIEFLRSQKPVSK